MVCCVIQTVKRVNEYIEMNCTKFQLFGFGLHSVAMVLKLCARMMKGFGPRKFTDRLIIALAFAVLLIVILLVLYIDMYIQMSRQRLESPRPDNNQNQSPDNRQKVEIKRLII